MQLREGLDSGGMATALRVQKVADGKHSGLRQGVIDLLNARADRLRRPVSAHGNVDRLGEAYDLDRFRLLLDRGADPSVAVDRHGANAVDAVLRRAVMQPPALGSIDSDKARAIIDLIAASPKAAIRASLAAQLKAEPTQWFVKSPEALAILVHARQKLAALPARADGAGTCERIEAGPGYEPGPLRLR